MKKKIVASLLTGVLAAAMLAGCGDSSGGNTTEKEEQTSADAETSTSGTEYKVGIVNYVDDASLNQIVENIEKELDAKGEELGVTFNYADY